MNKKVILIIVGALAVIGLAVGLLIFFNSNKDDDNSGDNNGQNGSGGSSLLADTLVCEKTEVDEGMPTKTKVEIKHSGNTIKSINQEASMEIESSMISLVFPAMEGMKQTLAGINGFTYDVKQESNGIKILQAIDFTKFTEAEARKLAERLDLPYEDYFDEAGEVPSLDKYRQTELAGYTCR